MDLNACNPIQNGFKHHVSLFDDPHFMFSFHPDLHRFENATTANLTGYSGCFA